MTLKAKSLCVLILSQICALSLWFITAAVLPDMLQDHAFSETRQAALTSAVPAGFVVGALVSALFGLSDRIDPRVFFVLSSAVASASGFALLLTVPGSNEAILLRFCTGAMLAGVYPVGMKLAVGWGKEDRGFLVSLLVGALTFGSASPFLISWLGGAQWQFAIAVAASLTFLSGVLVLFAKLGPFHQRAPNFETRAIREAWTNKGVRYAYLGYFGHMWELYAMWSWIGVAVLASYRLSMQEADAIAFSKLTAFLAICLGGVATLLCGYVSDRVGKAKTAIAVMAVSSAAGLASAASFGGSPWLLFVFVVIWGAAVIPDSPQFSALVADASTPQIAGSLMTLQTAIGFALTIFTVQLTRVLVDATSWPTAMVVMAVGPIFGIWFMRKL